MSEASRSDGAAGPTSASPDPDFDTAMRAELDRRIAALAEVDEAAFGTIGRAEWIVTVLVSIVLPLVLVWVLR